ncbi:hypothetical protein D3C79_733760 [compost metagenome]
MALCPAQQPGHVPVALAGLRAATGCPLLGHDLGRRGELSHRRRRHQQEPGTGSGQPHRRHGGRDDHRPWHQRSLAVQLPYRALAGPLHLHLQPLSEQRLLRLRPGGLHGGHHRLRLRQCGRSPAHLRHRPGPGQRGDHRHSLRRLHDDVAAEHGGRRDLAWLVAHDPEPPAGARPTALAAAGRRPGTPRPPGSHQPDPHHERAAHPGDVEPPQVQAPQPAVQLPAPSPAAHDRSHLRGAPPAAQLGIAPAGAGRAARGAAQGPRRPRLRQAAHRPPAGTAGPLGGLPRAHLLAAAAPVLLVLSGGPALVGSAGGGAAGGPPDALAGAPQAEIPRHAHRQL